MWADVAHWATWFDVVFGTTCAALAGAVGWSLVRGVAGSSRWWWVFNVGVGIAAIVVGTWVTPAVSPAVVWFTAAALVLAGVDALLLRLPNVLVYPTVIVVAMWLPAAAIILDRPHVAIRVLSAGAVAALVHLVLHLIAPDGLGMGDVKFAPAIAMVMGWYSWGWVLIAALGAFALAATWGIIRAIGRRGAKELPFGPFMVASAAITPVVGDPLIHWWL